MDDTPQQCKSEVDVTKNFQDLFPSNRTVVNMLGIQLDSLFDIVRGQLTSSSGRITNCLAKNFEQL